MVNGAPDGRLVIARTPTEASAQRRYDVVGRRGRLAGVITLRACDALIGFGGRSVYVLSTDAVGVQRLRRHSWP